jgi:hypothetical protein
MTDPAPLTGEPTNRLDAIEGRLNAATPGPWETNAGGYRHGEGSPEKRCFMIVAPDDEIVAVTPGSASGDRRDAALIANAPDDLRFLLSEVRRLQEALAEAQEDVARVDWLDAQWVIVNPRRGGLTIDCCRDGLREAIDEQIAALSTPEEKADGK